MLPLLVSLEGPSGVQSHTFSGGAASSLFPRPVTLGLFIFRLFAMPESSSPGAALFSAFDLTLHTQSPPSCIGTRGRASLRVVNHPGISSAVRVSVDLAVSVPTAPGLPYLSLGVSCTCLSKAGATSEQPGPSRMAPAASSSPRRRLHAQRPHVPQRPRLSPWDAAGIRGRQSPYLSKGDSLSASCHILLETGSPRPPGWHFPLK